MLIKYMFLKIDFVILFVLVLKLKVLFFSINFCILNEIYYVFFGGCDL